MNFAWLSLRKDVTSAHRFHLDPSSVLFPCAQFLWGPRCSSGLLIWSPAVQKRPLFEIRCIFGLFFYLASDRVCFRLFCYCSKIIFFAFRGLTSTQCSRGRVFLGEERMFCGTSPSFLFLCVYLPPITNCSVGTPSVVKLPLRVRSLWCEEMLAHVLGAIQPRLYGALAITVVPKFQQVCLILEQQHADEAILLYAFGGRLISAYSRPFALCSSTPRSYVLCVMPHVCVFISVCVFPPLYTIPNFIWLNPKPLSITNAFCRLSKYCCLVWGEGFLGCIFWGLWIFWLSAWNPFFLLLHSVYVELTAPGR